MHNCILSQNLALFSCGYELNFTLTHDTGTANPLVNTRFQAMLQRDVSGRAAPVILVRTTRDSRGSRGMC